MEVDHQNPVIETPVTTYEQSLLYLIFKRTIDFLLSFFLLIVLLPILLVISCCIKLTDSKGSVLFIQERVGLNQRRFRMYKFRTMCSDAEERLEDLLNSNEVEGAMFKMKEDPRVTGVGKYLRKYSLDELPQLINVIKGDMSLVGPRPCLTRELMAYTDSDKRRLMVKPGITGLWQVSGRSGLSFEQMVQLDLTYITHLSLLTDFKILLKTIKVVFKSDNAY